MASQLVPWKETRCSKMRPKVYSLIKSIPLLICTLGCICHFIMINLDYFQYSTVAMYVPYISLFHTIPLTSLCFAPHEVENETSFIDQRLPVDRSSLAPKDSVSVDAATVIADCAIWNFTSQSMETKDCSCFFNVTHSTRESYYICYTLDPAEDHLPMNEREEMIREYTLYSFSLVNKLLEFNRVAFFNHFYRWPEDELLHLIDTDLSNSRKKNSLFVLEHELLHFERLRAPYDTRCVIKQSDSCHSDNRSSLCNRHLCHHFLAITHPEVFPRKQQGIRIHVNSRDSLSHLFRYSPRTEANTFFLESCSVLGLWCSLSVSSLITDLPSIVKKKRKSSFQSTLINKWYCELVMISRVMQVDFVSIKKTVHRNLSNPSTVTSRYRRNSLIGAKIFILFLFCRQSVLLSVDYFEYKTVREIQLGRDADIQVPSISYCFSMSYWLQVRSPNYLFETFDENMSKFVSHFNMTLKQIFDSAPSVNSSMKKCRIRLNSTSPLQTTDECMSHFKVKKFYQYGMICYNFEPSVERKLLVSNFRFKDHHPRILYSIVVDDEITKPYNFQPIVSHDLPKYSRFYANQLYKFLTNELILLSYDITMTTKLPSPYDTRCNPSYDDLLCDLNFVNRSRLGLLLYSEVQRVPLEQRFVRYSDLKNETLAQLIKKTERQYSSKCRGLCVDTTTRTIQYRGYSSNEKLELALALPEYPLRRFDSVPVQTSYNYIYQLACCSSFWLGFSVLMLANFPFKRKPGDQSPSILIYLYRYTEMLARSFRVKNGLASVQMILHRIRSKQKARKLLLLVFLATGFTVHSIFMVMDYFQYHTITDTKFGVERDLSKPWTSVCVSFDQLDLEENYSHIDILYASPGIDEIFTECGHRGMLLPELSHLPRILQQRILARINSTLLCYNLFRVKKVIRPEKICYEITLRPGVHDAEYNIKYHINSIKSYQYLNLSPQLSQYNLSVSVGLADKKVSLVFATAIPSIDNSSSIWSWINYLTYHINSLPPPYDTGVLDKLRLIQCKNDCIRSSWKMEIDSISSRMRLIKDDCAKLCTRNSLKELKSSYFKTFHDPWNTTSSTRSGNGTHGLWFRTNSAPVPHTRLLPAMRLIDLIVHISTLYSIWFGLSAIQIVVSLFTKPAPQESEHTCNLCIVDELRNCRKQMSSA